VASFAKLEARTGALHDARMCIDADFTLMSSPPLRGEPLLTRWRWLDSLLPCANTLVTVLSRSKTCHEAVATIAPAVVQREPPEPWLSTSRPPL
jgi:hypothetical protein